MNSKSIPVNNCLVFLKHFHFVKSSTGSVHSEFSASSTTLKGQHIRGTLRPIFSWKSSGKCTNSLFSKSNTAAAAQGAELASM